MSNRNRTYEDDDGRVVAPMNVEGMPWWRPGARESGTAQSDEKPTRREIRSLAFNAFFAALFIAAVFAAGAFLFILFCAYVWLR